MKLTNKAGRAYNFRSDTAALFAPEHCDPKTSKPLVRVTGLVDERGRELPPFLVTCNTLVSMGEGGKLALSVWETQGPKTEGEA